MATPVSGPLGTLLASLSAAAEEAAEAGVDADMEEPARTLAVASTHLAILVELLGGDEAKGELGEDAAELLGWCYVDASEVLNSALLAVTDFLGAA